MEIVERLFDQSSLPVTLNFFSNEYSKEIDESKKIFENVASKKSSDYKCLRVGTYERPYKEDQGIAVDTVTLLSKEDIPIVQERHENLKVHHVYSLHKQYVQESSELLSRKTELSKPKSSPAPITLAAAEKVGRRNQVKVTTKEVEKPAAPPKKVEESKPTKPSIFQKKTTTSSKPANKKASKPKQEKKPVVKKVEEPPDSPPIQSKKRRIITFSSDESDNDDKLSSQPIVNQPKKKMTKIDTTEDSPADKVEVASSNKSDKESDTQEAVNETSASEPAKKRKRGRKTVAKTFLNSQGFMVTEKGWESYSETDSESEPNQPTTATTIPSAPETTKQPNKDKPRPAPAVTKGKKGKAVAGAKQTSLMNFFKKN